MPEDYKGKKQEKKTRDKQKTYALVKLGSRSKERYDSYGHKIEEKKPPETKSAEIKPPQKTPNIAPPKDTSTRYREHRTHKPANKIYTNVTKKENEEKKTSQHTLPAHEKRIKNRKVEKKKVIISSLKAAGFLIIIAIMIFLILRKDANEKNLPATAFISTGTIENSFSTKIHIIRDETAIQAGFSGKLIAAVNDGDRVAAGKTVAYIIKPEYEDDLNKLRNIEKKITAAQNAAEYLDGEISTELSEVNAEILIGVNKLAALYAENKTLQEYSMLIEELDRLYELKNEIIMNADSTDSYINSLKSEREAILQRMQNSMHEVKTTKAGIVSFYTDSETVYASQKIKMINDYLNGQTEAAGMLSEDALRFNEAEATYMVGRNVSQNETIARITPYETYYIAADISELNDWGLRKGKSVIIKSSDRSFSINASVADLLKYGDRTYVLFKSSTGLAGAISRRIVSSDIVVDYSEGIKVPKRALSEWDSAGLTARIAIIRANYVSYVYVKILAEDNEYAIVSNSNDFVSDEDKGITSIRINDLYVINHETVTEGQVIGG